MEHPGHDFVCAPCLPPDVRAPARTDQPPPEKPAMSRYLAPLGFTLAAVWVAVLFVLASSTH
ncbi:hypothetical protein V6U90_18140 [Micromonospora sp. CPCC 206060]|uniref:hypothetical protein n=1 Tax=Micromonospora sp. CPCC 206060 TaxID=3122406 RepID=UPI002FF02CFC